MYLGTSKYPKARRTYKRLCVFTTQLNRREQTCSRLERVHCHDAIQTLILSSHLIDRTYLRAHSQAEVTLQNAFSPDATTK